ncbi:uncharacterized protein G2W53_016206 [Senna tora]|uniref:Uncharacterized protein n=1 Tax=Senna tora TaxID=362788 RepID=A0A834TPE7_9FABA|nr:uncharacterized protein G2W53_016206 [Senna tora]
MGLKVGKSPLYKVTDDQGSWRA